ncbi:MAG: hypothetical protein M1457_14015, partial [bacterium]|nr:hypothetical protein [bacterium]
MTIHLKRFGWLYLTLAVMAAVPVMIIRAQRVPPLDFKTIRAWAAWVDGEMARRYGPPAKVSVQAFLDQHQELRGWPDPLYRLVVFEVEPDAAGAPILAPMLATMHRMYDPGLAAWEAYCHGPLVYTPLTRELDVLNSPALDGKNHWDRYGMAVADRDVGHFDGAVNMERTFGAQRLGGSLVTDADWLAALAHFDAAAHAVDITRAGSPYTQYRSAQWRQIAYSGFDSLMAARPLNLDDPPTSAGAALDGAALARLVAQRAADPRLDSLASALHQKSMIPDLIDSHLMWGRPATQGDTLELRSAELLGFALSVSEQRDRFRHASLRRWAAAFSRRLELSDNWSSMPNDTLYGNGWVWTAIPDIRVFLRRAIAREPVLFESFPLNAEERRDLDPWTMAYLNLEPFGSLSSYQKFYISTRVTMTKGRLLEAAFAARAYCRERGRWPERLDELVPAYLPAGSLEPAWWAAHRDVSNYGPNTPYLPYHIGWLATDNRLRMALWEQSLPLSPLNQYSPLFYSLDPSDGLLDCGDTGNWTTTPA